MAREAILTAKNSSLGSFLRTSANRSLAGYPISAQARKQTVRPSALVLSCRSLVQRLGSDRTRLYRASDRHPLVQALAATFSAEQQRFDRILSGVRVAADESRIIGVWVFGSVAHCEDTIDSDLDIAVLIDAEDAVITEIADIIRDRLREAGDELGFAPSVVPMSSADVRRLRSEGPQLWSDILRDALVLTGRPPSEVAAHTVAIKHGRHREEA